MIGWIKRSTVSESSDRQAKNHRQTGDEEAGQEPSTQQKKIIIDRVCQIQQQQGDIGDKEGHQDPDAL